jgi:hypothetical protein
MTSQLGVLLWPCCCRFSSAAEWALLESLPRLGHSPQGDDFSFITALEIRKSQ